MFVKGQVGYINGTKVDYTKNNLKNFIDRDAKFREEFTEYMYKGDTITNGETGDGLETIIGNTKPEDKIVIKYTELEV